MVVSEHYLKKYSHHPIQTCDAPLLGECSEIVRFWAILAQFGPSSDKKWLKVGRNDGFRSLSEKVFTQSSSYLVCTLIGWVFRIDSLLGHVGPLVAKKWLKMVGSDKCLKKYSRNPMQTWCVQLLGECSELIRFWATLAKFWPSSGHKMTENGGFRPLSGHLCISIPSD